mgnify:CR=1 FL=1
MFVFELDGGNRALERAGRGRRQMGIRERIETNAGLAVADTLTVTDLDLSDTVTPIVTTVVESGTTSGIANATLFNMMTVTDTLTYLTTTGPSNWR